MTFCEALDIDPQKGELVCFVGAGGKTTAMFRLARELKGHGKRVLVTTTTNIAYPREDECDRVIIENSERSGDLAAVKRGTITCLGGGVSSDGKLVGVSEGFVSGVYEQKTVDHVLVEGDGSKGKPVKAPADHEPQIPEETTKVVGVIGLDCLGKAIDGESVHRPELFCEITGREVGDTTDEDALLRLILSEKGLFKGVPGICERYLLLNKAESEERRRSVDLIGALVAKNKFALRGLLVASMADGWVDRVKWSE